MSGVTNATSGHSAGPILSPSVAAALLISYAVGYVAPLYMSARTRPSRSLSRDAPQVIRARIASVTASTTACSLATYAILSYMQGHSASSALHAMGYWPVGVAESWRALLLLALLFAGPLYEALLIDGLWSDWLRLAPLRYLWQDWPTWRNIVVGPVTEEVLFRSASIPVLILAGVPARTIVFLTPLIFGLAHIHHFYEFRVTHPWIPISTAVLRTVLQLTYTSMFGAFASFLFLRTGSLLTLIVAHAFCNSMGLPRFWGRLEPYWLSGKTAEASVSIWFYTGLYYILLVVGAYTWYRQLWPLTESSMALIHLR